MDIQTGPNFLPVGSEVPDVTVADQAGNPVSLKDYRGKKIVLYFYPKDNTPGCTNEACSLRDDYSELQAQGFEVIGVSPDSETKHRNFINKFSLPFTLLSDPELKLIKAFGAWGEKKMYGKTYDGLLRTTFLIDEEGKVSHVINKVKTKEHGQQILSLLAS
ncbi:thioredoxin-dependent thiol peroxidase [Pontibacter sp. G13]|uniref:thioredoxin-dependent thiol peroxidase n=1 Tax=Pontibacter sp. G13 TaxID=3074898 RepID=UPI0028898A6C|nr:thioredoxin-dependent thiol peroxidase [Pontibacter sp. G13]WNJ17347.1 thioredoxin-dependent thiol peroxidase [Pontibacter sp. G13]